MSERLKNNTKKEEPKSKVISRLSNLLERKERELPRFREYRHLMKVSHELGLSL